MATKRRLSSERGQELWGSVRPHDASSVIGVRDGLDQGKPSRVYWTMVSTIPSYHLRRHSRQRHCGSTDEASRFRIGPDPKV